MERDPAGQAPATRPTVTWWRIGFGVATLLVLLFGTQTYFAARVHRGLVIRAGRGDPGPRSWLEMVLHEVPVWYVWLLLTPAIVALVRRFPLATARRRNAHVLIHVCASMVAVLVVMVLVVAVDLLAGSAENPLGLTYLESVAFGVLRYAMYFVTIYAMIVAGHEAIANYQAYQARAVRAAQLEGRLAAAQLEVLRAQLHPHFLFNTLNTITALMHRDVGAAQAMVVELGEMLRESLSRAPDHEVPLQAETDSLQRFLRIQAIRFPERLSVEFDLDPDSLGSGIPPLLLTPLAEILLRDGMSFMGGCRVAVSTRVSERRLLIRMRCVAAARGDVPGSAVLDDAALQSTRSRLAHLYGAEQRVHLHTAGPGAAELVIELPFHPLPGHEDKGRV